MTNYEFLKKCQRLQDGVMYDGLINLGFATIGYSNTDKSFFWNTAVTNVLLTDDQISEIERKFKTLDRTSTVYFENATRLKPLADKLTSNNYKKAFEDSWQFWKGGIIDQNRFGSARKVTNDKGLKEYLETFNACYQKGDPQNPYGLLGDYLKVAKDIWHKHNKSNRLEYFTVYKNNKPVAVSALTNFEGIGYISNVGSLREVRGEGFGKLATLYCVSLSIKKGNNEHCLATEEGAYPNEFYKRIGFKTRFTAVGYTYYTPEG